MGVTTLWKRKTNPVAAAQAEPPARIEDDLEFLDANEKRAAILSRIDSTTKELDAINEKHRLLHLGGGADRNPHNPMQAQVETLLESGQLPDVNTMAVEVQQAEQMAAQIPILRHALAEINERLSLVTRHWGHLEYARLANEGGELYQVRVKQIQLARELKDLIEEESRIVGRVMGRYTITPSCDVDRQKVKDALIEVIVRRDV